MPNRSWCAACTMIAHAIIACGLTACSATHIVRPLPHGASVWTASLGGPVVPSSVPTKVLPYLSAGWQRGVADNLTLGGAVHGTMAVFGVAGGELTATRRLVGARDDRFNLAATAQAYLFAGRGGARFFPAAGAVGSWTWGSNTLLYGGGTVLAQFTGSPSAVVNPLAGVQRNIGRRATVQAELKWMAANADTRNGVFEGESSVSGHGAIALQLGATLRRGEHP